MSRTKLTCSSFDREEPAICRSHTSWQYKITEETLYQGTRCRDFESGLGLRTGGLIVRFVIYVEQFSTRKLTRFLAVDVVDRIYNIHTAGCGLGRRSRSKV